MTLCNFHCQIRSCLVCCEAFERVLFRLIVFRYVVSAELFVIMNQFCEHGVHLKAVLEESLIDPSSAIFEDLDCPLQAKLLGKNNFANLYGNIFRFFNQVFVDFLIF